MTPRIIKNGFVAAVGQPCNRSHIATGWSMGFPVGGFAITKSNSVSVTSCFWSKQYLSTPPPAPDIIEPRLVLGGDSNDYQSVDFPLQILGLKSPNETYVYDSTVIAYTNGIEFSGIIQRINRQPWELELELEEGEEVTLTLITSNMFGLSTSSTTLNITQIPEPFFIVGALLLVLVLIRLKHRYKAFICLILLTLLFFNSNNVNAAKFNYQGVIELEGGAYSGDGYFKFTIGDAAQNTNFWANDGSVQGEPVASRKLNVSNGFFHVAIGDSMMMPIPKNLFSSTNNLYLTVWFNYQPINGFYKLGPPQEILPVPLALNADLLDGHDYKEIIDTVYTNSSELFLLKTGDVCSGQLQVSNLVTDSNVELPDAGRVYLNSSKDAYISAGNTGNITIFKNNSPVFEIE